jgi:hypothetical protein
MDAIARAVGARTVGQIPGQRVAVQLPGAELRARHPSGDPAPAAVSSSGSSSPSAVHTRRRPPLSPLSR